MIPDAFTHLPRLRGRVTPPEESELRVTPEVLAVWDQRARQLGRAADWRLSDHNVWKAERVLLDAPHRPIKSSDARYQELLRKYTEFRRTHDDRKPLYYRNRHTWSALPRGNW